MQERIHFTRDQLKVYFSLEFPYGKDFKPAFTGSQLVETKREDGCFVHVAMGAPVLKDQFVGHMDDTLIDYVPHARMREILDGMRRLQPETTTDIHMNHLHAALYWWVFHRNQGVTQAKIAEKIDVSEKTIQRWLKLAFNHVIRELKPAAFGAQIISVEHRPIYAEAV